jgi:hypothetical protein
MEYIGIEVRKKGEERGMEAEGILFTRKKIRYLLTKLRSVSIKILTIRRNQK